LFGGVASKLAAHKHVAWNIRSSLYDLESIKPQTKLVIKGGALFSRSLAQKIVCNSSISVEQHMAIGYPGEKFETIPNGFELSRYTPDPEAKTWLCNSLGVAPDAHLVGIIGRFHPNKDHRGFVAAAGRVQNAKAHFVMVGKDVAEANLKLVGWIRDAGIESRCHLLGLRDDIPHIAAGLDLCAMSSRSEGFPNVVGEAMACGVPAVVTDVGDAAYLVGETGIVVPPRDPEALAKAIDQLLSEPDAAKEDRKRAARLRVEQHFSIESVAARYRSLYASMLNPE
jgi:glycosyltransferase involved in cell wall biosynthesis